MWKICVTTPPNWNSPFLWFAFVPPFLWNRFYLLQFGPFVFTVFFWALKMVSIPVELLFLCPRFKLSIQDDAQMKDSGTVSRQSVVKVRRRCNFPSKKIASVFRREKDKYFSKTTEHFRKKATFKKLNISLTTFDQKRTATFIYYVNQLCSITSLSICNNTLPQTLFLFQIQFIII